MFDLELLARTVDRMRIVFTSHCRVDLNGHPIIGKFTIRIFGIESTVDDVQ